MPLAVDGADDACARYDSLLPCLGDGGLNACLVEALELPLPCWLTLRCLAFVKSSASEAVVFSASCGEEKES